MPRAIRVPLKRYFTRSFKKDLLAGLTVGVISLPLAMAFAIASAVNPEYGIYTTIIAMIIIVLSRIPITIYNVLIVIVF